MTLANPNQKNILTAYLLWCCGLDYCCGIHRSYLGKSGSEMLYFCKLGFLGLVNF
ncbi:NINE protein [Synechococcus elongatus]|uniref:NINE protein n=1 Tax=Synechococcus elongatus TaxID=32046 RepID=UPI001EDE6F13|nr:NINE protein [Synechococcus elongatus]